MYANPMMKTIAEIIRRNALNSYKDIEQANVWKVNAESRPASMAFTSTQPTTVASSTPTIVAGHHVRNVLRHVYAQKDHVRHNVKRRSPNAITNVTTTRTTSAIAADVTRYVPKAQSATV